VYECGKEDGPVIVLSNGLGGLATAWRYVFEELWDHYRIVSWDYRGLYRSEPAPEQGGFPLDCHVQDLKEVLDHLNVEEAIFLGWSMGVQVNYEFAHEHPEYVQAIVAINGTSGNPFKTILKTGVLGSTAPLVAKGLRSSASIAPLLAPLIARGTSLIPLFQRFGLLGPNLQADVAVEQIEAYVQLDYKNYADILEGLDAHDSSEFLNTIEKPVLIIAGKKDVITPLECSEKMDQILPNSRLVVLENASHYAPIESTSELNLLIQEFLGQLRGSKSVLAQSD
jgi:pimeloyl-ACP methyl ester carboxylesterase